MGWSFRKTIRLGKGLNINFSKRGIGFSAGIPGFRIGWGGGRKPRLTAGRGMFRYQKTLSEGAGESQSGGCGCLGLIVGIVVAVALLGYIGSKIPDQPQPSAAPVVKPKPQPSEAAPTAAQAAPPSAPLARELTPGGRARTTGKTQFILDNGVMSIPAGEVVEVKSLTEKEAEVMYRGTKGKVLRLRLRPAE